MNPGLKKPNSEDSSVFNWPVSTVVFQLPKAMLLKEEAEKTSPGQLQKQKQALL
jgi:hypothetical protein